MNNQQEDLLKKNAELEKELVFKNRELEIEAAVDRVRTRAMAMQTSEELNALIGTVFIELIKLDPVLTRCIIMIYDPETNDARWWMANAEAPDKPLNFLVKYHEHLYNPDYLKAWQSQTLKWQYVLEGNIKKEWDNFLFTETELSLLPDFVITEMKAPDRVYLNASFNNFGSLTLASLDPLPGEHFEILLRFAKEFDLSYTRFNDLKKAEAQARETQVELSLERVRAQTMAMHNSRDIAVTVAVMFEEMLKLGIGIIRCGIGIIREPHEMETWAAKSDAKGKVDLLFGRVNKMIHPLLENGYNAWKSQQDFCSYELEGNDVINYFIALNNQPDYPAKQDISVLPPRLTHSAFFFPEGAIFIFSLKPLSSEVTKVFKRFARVFGQTYRRYLDLQKVEANIREAQIEAALERVRTSTMAMQRSEDLSKTAFVLFKQFKELGESPERIFIATFDEDNDQLVDIWGTNQGGNQLDKRFKVPVDEPTLIKKIFKGWKEKIKSFIVDITGDELKKYLAFLNQAGIPVTEGIMDDRRVQNVASFSKGVIGVTSSEPYPLQSMQLLERFAGVFDLTYTRFLDLKQAEAQAREAQIETALERVRSRTLAMQKSDELTETAGVLFKQLINLGIEPSRLYIAIIKDKKANTEIWITDEDEHKISSGFEVNLNKNASLKKMYEGWKRQKKSITLDLQGEELREYFQYLNKLNVPFKGSLLQKRRVHNIAYFNNGFIGMASTDAQPETTLKLMERFAYVFNLTFTRFNDLKLAEAQAEQARLDLIQLQAEKQRAETALSDLKAAQAQLIQSEKMASLGELTAGIAHEIQNPLNFVNNFSEINTELIDELKNDKSNLTSEDRDDLLTNIFQNNEKIIFHGKRADAIVKNMLQHSRTNTGQKEATDINALCDEYLRLSYHGMRAKDKEFNADFKTYFDETISKINIIPQDIARVLLNLFNNAFYAVNEKAKKTDAGYQPTVTVSIKKLNDKFEIIISDNGNGIPQKVVDKIFQPFFTTKPTGEGTGLGLSLSYDIIKAHGGEIKVETKETEGTRFIVRLQTNF